MMLEKAIGNGLTSPPESVFIKERIYFGMHIEISENPPGHDWESLLGVSRDVVIGKILAGDWLDNGSSDFVLKITQQRTDPYSLYFERYNNPDDYARARNFSFGHPYSEHSKLTTIAERPEFNIIFNYQGVPRSIRIRNIFFKSASYQGMGAGFLGAVSYSAIDLGCDRIFVEPGLDGSAYWTSRGALIQEWPNDNKAIRLDERFQRILNKRNNFAVNWQDEDFEKLRKVFENRDCFGLNELIARDDLYVRDDIGELRLRRYLVTDVPMGECIFELTNPWTLQCLRERAGVNLAAKSIRQIAAPSGPVFPGQHSFSRALAAAPAP